MSARASGWPRVRRDRVALALIGRLEEAARDIVPDGLTVVVTVTAPIRRPASTGREIERKIATLLAAHDRPDREIVVDGNRVAMRVVPSAPGTQRLIGYVHNPDPGAAEALLDETQARIRPGWLSQT